MRLNILTCKLVELYLSSLDCPRSLAIWLMFSNNEHRQLVEMECNPDHYNDPDEFRRSYLATKFLSRATFLSTNIDKKAVALEKFSVAEQECRKINQRGYHWTTIVKLSSEWLHNAIIRKIESVLGEFSGEEMVEVANWGPGVTTLIKGCDTGPVNKFRLENGTTRPLDDLMGDLYAVAYPTWDLRKRKLQVGNQIVTVPKNSKTDRTIAIEPGLNLWFQKGIGNMIRRRLRRFGIDLNDQSRNQRLSRVGSKFNHLATVDFRAASDTVAYSTVKELLPEKWFNVMNILRSRLGLMGKQLIEYEKFSSMGNGFTFELESLIFYAIAMSVCEYLHLPTRDVSVYGDDVIIPSAAFDLYLKTCAFYGFTVNPEKSFHLSEFRESCGAHWFHGTNCKPYFLEEIVKGESKIYLAANSIRRLSYDSSFEFCDARFFECWQYLRRQIGNPCLIPEGYGDGGFISNFDEATPSRCKNGIEGYRTTFLADIPLRYASDDHPVLLARLKGRSIEMAFGNRSNLRGRIKQKRKRLFISRWTNLGPWF